MDLFKKQKRQLRDFLNKHDGNPFITIPVQFCVGLALFIAVILGLIIIAIPLGLLSEVIGPGWVIGGGILVMIIWFVGFMTCFDIQCSKVP